MNEIIKMLVDIGLTEKEALAYTILLKSGRSDIRILSSISRIKRPTMYLVLEELRKKRLCLKNSIS